MTVSAPGGTAPAVLSIQPRVPIALSAITATIPLIEVLLSARDGV
jgi:hypothetical protein